MIEVMIAIILTAVAVIGLVALYTVETRSSGVSRHSTEAAVTAEEKLEFLRTQNAPTTGSDTVSELTGQASYFARNWCVVADGGIAAPPCPACPPTTPGTFCYSVTVSWSEDGSPRNVTILDRR
jgi:Tfp pilus assembly protein PilV